MSAVPASRTCERCGRTTGPRDGRAPRYCATCGRELVGDPRSRAGDRGARAGDRRARAAMASTPPAATAALLLGLFSLIPLAGVVFAMLAIPLGLNATRQIDDSGGKLKGRGMAVAGLALSLLASALWVILCFGVRILG